MGNQMNQDCSGGRVPTFHSLVSPQQQGSLSPHPSLPPIVSRTAFTKVTRELTNGHLFSHCLTCPPVVFDTSDHSFPSGMPPLAPMTPHSPGLGQVISPCLIFCPSAGFHLSPGVHVLHGGLFHPLHATPQAHVYISQASAAFPGCPPGTQVSLVRMKPWSVTPLLQQFTCGL